MEAGKCEGGSYRSSKRLFWIVVLIRVWYRQLVQYDVEAKNLETQKVYVDVVAEFTKDGILLPRQITWEDGREVALFYEDNNMWFMERAGA